MVLEPQEYSTCTTSSEDIYVETEEDTSPRDDVKDQNCDSRCEDLNVREQVVNNLQTCPYFMALHGSILELHYIAVG